ncbi:MAG: TIGR00730 family Rossman fold protein [Bacteroidales bacterium]|nr:TIGR00730 family Rossman fold protein [Bacteroidales bacterium]
MSGKRALIYCSSSFDIDPSYNEAARQVVRAACLAGYDIVSGGSWRGTMGHVCDEALKYGVQVIGVLPRFMKGFEHPGLTECIWTERMSQRKDIMREGADLAIALPGGIGTLDEIAETCCLAKLGRYPGRVVVFNPDGFYEPLRQQLDRFVERGMMDAEFRSKVHFPSTVEELQQLL